MSQTEITPITQIKTSRIIGHIQGKGRGPTLVFFGGIHGNEPSGVTALEKVFRDWDYSKYETNGTIYGIRGNIPALLEKKRFLEKDLNRIWTNWAIEEIKTKNEGEYSSEEKELLEIHRIITDILATQSPPFYFIDFHTTSSRTAPFITINDALINRRFSRLFPVPVILGIEEYLDGPLLSYINERGYVSLGFESGQHIGPEAVDNSVAFIWLSMVFAGFLNGAQVPEVKMYYRQLKSVASAYQNFYEVIHRHAIEPDDNFRMCVGLVSFDNIEQGSFLAEHNGKDIFAEDNAIIFMPLYQEQGEEGFFLIRKIPTWALVISTFFRYLRLDALLTILPGVSWATSQKEKLLVNIKIAKFLSKPFFHLLGYRNKVLDNDRLLMRNRERTSKKEMYKRTWWYSKQKNLFKR